MRRRGFTLVELLVVIGIIAMLIALIMPTYGKVRDQSVRLKCASNLRQIVLAMHMYAGDDRKRTYLYAPPGRDDDLTGLYPKYLRHAQVAICPATDNRVRPNVLNASGKPVDLANNAGTAGPANGHSYEGRAYINPDTGWPDGRYFGTHKTHWLKTMTLVKRPDKVFIMVDGDDDGAMAGEINNWPGVANNHRKPGLNAAFCDGHVEWVMTGRPMLELYVNGYYSPPNSAEHARYGLIRNGKYWQWR